MDDAIYTLRVAKQQFDIWLNVGSIKTIEIDGKKFISKTDFRKLAYDENAHKSAINFLSFDIQRREEERLTKNDEFIHINSRIISKYRGYIKTLEYIHASYQGQLNILHTESALIAAYLLYYKVINLLYISCTCLENLYWHSTVLLRPIDETIDLAIYFIITEDTDEGKRNLKKWFRENSIISHSICRQAITGYENALLNDGRDKIHCERLSELYRKKSKMIHPTHHGTIEPYRAMIGDNWIMYRGIDYAGCSYARKILEITEFFQSSIWSAIQGFLTCFWKNIPLRKEDWDALRILDEKFYKEVDNQ
ncbi:MAG: hypothetical protein ABII09_11320 [Planctomycetota bacterium]